MGQVTLSIGGFSYGMPCKDGEEAHLLALGEKVNAKVMQAIGAVGGASEIRGLLFASLLFADELAESRPGGPATSAPQQQPDSVLPALETLALRLEQLATGLETLAR